MAGPVDMGVNSAMQESIKQASKNSDPAASQGIASAGSENTQGMMPNSVTGNNSVGQNTVITGGNVDQMFNSEGMNTIFKVGDANNNILSAFDGPLSPVNGLTHEGFDMNNLGNVDIGSATSPVTNLNAKTPTTGITGGQTQQ